MSSAPHQADWRAKVDAQHELNEKNGTTTGKEMLAYVKSHAAKGDVEAVLKAVDEFGWKGQWMMNVGDKKGAILDAALEKAKPSVNAMRCYYFISVVINFIISSLFSN